MTPYEKAEWITALHKAGIPTSIMTRVEKGNPNSKEQRTYALNDGSPYKRRIGIVYRPNHENHWTDAIVRGLANSTSDASILCQTGHHRNAAEAFICLIQRLTNAKLV